MVNIPLLRRRRLGFLQDLYAVLGFSAPLVADFEEEYYRKAGAVSTFDSTFTHSRAGNATMVDSDGLIKWAPHNLLTYSEDFTDADWVKGANCSETANTITNTGTNTVYIYQSVGTISAGIIYSASMRVQKTTARYFQLVIGLYSGINRYAVLFDLDDGSFVEEANTPGQISNKDYAVEVLGDGEYRFTVTGSSANSGLGYIIAECTNTLPVTRNSDLNFTNATSGVSVTVNGSSFYRSDLGGMVNNPDRGDSYVPTTSAAVYQARRNHYTYNGTSWVNSGLLLETEARTNVLPNSDLFGWGETRSVLSFNQSTSPDGTNNATKIASDLTLANSHRSGFIVGNPLAASDAYTFSAWVKNNGTNIQFDITVDAANTVQTRQFFVYFDLQTGTARTPFESNSPTNTNYGIEDWGDGWYRCFATCGNPDGTRVDVALTLSNLGASVVNPIFDGDGTSGVYVYGAQFEAGATPSSYIPTTGASDTRALETLTIPAAKMAWPTPNVIGPELVTNGEFIGDSTTGWTPSDSTLSASSEQLIITSDGSSGNKSAYQVISGLTAGKVYQAKVDCITALYIGSFRIGAGPNQSQYGFSTLTTGQQASLVFTAPGTSVYLTVLFFDNSGDVSKTLTADNISVREIDPLSVSLQMQGKMTYADTNAVEEILFARWYAGPTQYIQINHNTSGTNRLEYRQQSDATLHRVLINNPYSPGVDIPYNVAMRNTSTAINGAFSGTAATAVTTPTALPDLSASDFDLGQDYMGTIAQFRAWNKDIGDAGIALASAEPVNRLAPVISGGAFVGSVLTTTDGTWNDSPTFTYQWLRNGGIIAGATSSTYTLVLADDGANITCRVTATINTLNTSVVSNSLGPVSVASGAAALAGSETEAFALDFTDSSIYVKDTGTPANDIDQSGLFNAAGEAIGPQSRLTYTNPTPKQVLQADGLLKFGAHNLYVNSEAPADQSVTLVNGASYVMTITGGVSITVSGAATGTYTAGDNAFTAASGTLTCGSTSGSGTVHLRRTPSVSAYVKTGASAVYALPIDHDTSGNQIGVLVEPQATNLSVNQPTTGNLVSAGVIATAGQTDPSGTTTALKLEFDGGDDDYCYFQNIGSTAAGTYTGSLYIKADSATDIGIRIASASAGTPQTVDVVSVTTQWKKFHVTFTSTISDQILFGLDTRSSITGDDGAAKTVYVAFVQVETGSVATSYIPTYGTTVTRSADDITEQLTAIPHDATQHSVYVQYLHKEDTSLASYVLSLDDGPPNTEHEFIFNNGAAITARIYDGGALLVNETQGTAVQGSTFRTAYALAANDFAMTTDGLTVKTDASVTLPTVTDLRLGKRSDTIFMLNGYIKQVMYLPRRVSNTDLQTLTSTGALP